MSYLVKRIQDRYESGVDGKPQLERYVIAGVITAAEYENITDEAYGT